MAPKPTTNGDRTQTTLDDLAQSLETLSYANGPTGLPSDHIDLYYHALNLAARLEDNGTITNTSDLIREYRFARALARVENTTIHA